ncbi:MAG: tetratricopeptide repeat protein, partial [Candidatus Firestonebacteria bacterium]
LLLNKTFDLRSPFRKIIILTLVAFGILIINRYVRCFLGEVNYFEGFKLSKKNALQMAIPELEKAKGFQRLEVNNNYELANCYARTGQRDKAIAAYKEALRANAGYDEIYFNMATVLLQFGKVEDAIEEYSRTLHINPLSLEAYTALGSIFLQTPDLYAAGGVKLFEQCLFLFPKNKDVWNNLGFLYTKSGRDQDALNAYNKALEIDPDFELAKKNIKITLLRLGRTDNKLETTEKLFQSIEKNVVSKNWQAALDSCERLVAMSPRSFKGRLYLANIYFTIGRLDEAINQYHEALKLEPGNPSAIGNLALAYFENKQYDLARNEFARVLQIDPENQIAKEKVAELNTMLNRR